MLGNQKFSHCLLCFPSQSLCCTALLSSFNGKIKSALLSKYVSCMPDTHHSSPFPRQSQGEGIARSPLLKSGKARCLGGAEQLASRECPAQPAPGVRCYESQCPSISSRVNHTPWLGLWEKIHEGHRPRCRTCQIHIKTRRVCESGRFILCAPRLCSLNANSWKGQGGASFKPPEVSCPSVDAE